MTNKLLLSTLLITLLTLVSGCENVPTDRPLINQDSVDQTGNVDQEPDEKEVIIPNPRPVTGVSIKPGFCGCADGLPITLGNCEAFCLERQAQGNNQAQLFFEVELSTDITSSTYESLGGWCRDEVQDADGNTVSTDHSCAIEVIDEKGTVSEIPFPVDIQSTETSFTVDISGFAEDETYRIAIKEVVSGYKSLYSQVRRISAIFEDRTKGPLQIMPIHRYSCMIVNGGASGTQQNTTDRFHLYFNSQTRPEPLQESTVGSFFCHDKQTYGNRPINNPLLEETSGVFKLWFKDDPRFIDKDKNGALDINDLIEQEVKTLGSSLSQKPQLFSELTWMSAFDDGDASTSNNNTAPVSIIVKNRNLGYMMTPFIDNTSDNYISFCPTQQHYNSSSALFQALKKYITVDTEAIYVAKQENACDFVLINESIANKIWFYKENGKNIQATNENIRGKTVNFYWPADLTSPFIKKAHQKVYTVRSPEELADACSDVPSQNGDSNNSSGVRTEIAPHDKRIGCIPKL